MNMMKTANDLGYGSVKAIIDDKEIQFPSVFTIEREQDIASPVEFESKSQKDEYMKEFLNHMDVTISSSSIKTPGRFLIGQNAVDQNLPLTHFDINDYAGKAESDYSLILTLSMIAGAAVEQAYEEGKDLSEPLKVNTRMAAALPVKEGSNIETKNMYRERYAGSTHQVTFHNFKNPITVTIEFDKVFVATEGETAQLFISTGKDKDLTKKIKEDFDTRYPEMASLVKAEDLIQAKNVVSIDIGAGTVDIVVIVNGKALVSASYSLSEGYDNALEEALEVLRDKKFNFSSVAELKEFLATKPSPLSRGRYEAVQKVVYAQLEPFCDRIVIEVSRSVRKAGATIEVVYVHGGGSIPMKDQTMLRTKLEDKLKDFNGGQVVPVIWITKEKAQTLNRDGLEFIVDHAK